MRSLTLLFGLMLVCVLACIPFIAFGAEEGTSQEKIKQLYNQALTYEKRGDSARAIPLYKETIALGAKDVAVFLNLALIYKEASQYKEAIAVLKDALQRNEGDQSKKWRSPKSTTIWAMFTEPRGHMQGRLRLFRKRCR